MRVAVGYQLATLCGVQMAGLVEEFVHIHTAQLGNTLLLRHAIVEFVNALFQVGAGGCAAGQ